MPTLNQIYQMMQEQNTPYIRVLNLEKEKLYVFEYDDVQVTIEKMKEFMPFLETYGKVYIVAADKDQKAANYRYAAKWTCTFDRKEKESEYISGPKNPWAWKIPDGYISADVMQKELQLINMKIDYENKLREERDKAKEKEKEDPVTMIEKFGPVLMYAMGKPFHEIQQVSNLYKGTMIAGPAASVKTQGTNHLSFSDVEKLTDQEKAVKCQQLADELAKYISIEHMILLQEGLIKKLKENPAFINVILTYI